MVPADYWPLLSHLCGLHPRDVRVPPEKGGLTWAQIEAYVEWVEDYMHAQSGG